MDGVRTQDAIEVAGTCALHGVLQLAHGIDKTAFGVLGKNEALNLARGVLQGCFDRVKAEQAQGAVVLTAVVIAAPVGALALAMSGPAELLLPAGLARQRPLRRPGYIFAHVRAFGWARTDV